MFASYINETGGPEVFQFGELPTPDPGPGQVLIKVICAGVNPADWKNRQGMLAQYRPYSFPYVIGFDAAGIVAALGDGVDSFSIGDRVFTPTDHGQGGQGSYAEYTLAGSDKVALMPPSLSFESAASIPVAALTAWQGIHDRGGLSAGDTAYIHGGSGGVGSFAVQFAKAAGARVAASCSSNNVDYLASLGVDRVIDYTCEDIGTALGEWAPSGLDYLMEAVGVSTLPRALDLVRDRGTYVSIPTLVDDGDIVAAAHAAVGRGIRREFSVMDDGGCAGQLATIAQLLVEQTIQLPPVVTYPLSDVALVHGIIERGHTRGKLVLRIAEDP